MMPTKYKYMKGEKKYILKRVAEKLLPKDIIYRKKQGFSAPIKEWFNGKLGKYMVNTINTSKLKGLDIFDYRFIGDMIKNQRDGKSDNSARLWSLYNLSEWYGYWFA
jgi:asparagine synthase (glutamine-hydrolysing)